jgi:trehalose 6-phosphate phosphatase
VELDIDSARVAGLLAPLRSDPRSAAVISDLDGTLAPIVERPGDARVPSETRELLADLAGVFGLVAIVSGRRAADARSLVGLDQLTYIGNHGLERLDPGSGEQIVMAKEVERGRDVERFARAHLDRTMMDSIGLRTEDKGPILALHWRGAPDEQRAAERAAEIATEASEQGLETHRGRKVLELRPRLDVDKGTAITGLLTERSFVAALYAGDDRTDLDGFRALRSMRSAGYLTASVTVGIAAAESPPEIAETADIVIPDPPGFLAILGALAH